MSNIYSAPTADLSAFQQEDGTYEPSVFQLKGRIGRVRYLAYSMCTTMAISFAVGILMFATGETPGLLAMVLMYIPIIAISIILVVRRLNDMNRSGWLAPLILVPIVNFLFGLYLLFGSGTEGPNEYGPAPSPNTTLVVIGAWLIPVVAIVGILAAVAIPAYQDYTTRATQSR